MEFGGELPCDEAVMRAFAGVGVKCANLALGIRCGPPVRLAIRVGTPADGHTEDRAAEGRVWFLVLHLR